MIKRYSDLIILSIIWIVSIYSVISVITNSYVIGIQNYIGYGLLIGVSILRFYKIKKIKTILGILLVFGTINAVQFTYSSLTIVFSWTPPGHIYSTFGIQPLSISLLFFLILVNFSDLMKMLTDIFSEDPEVALQRYKTKIDNHYIELKDEKNIKLNDIINNKDMYQIEYVKAAQKLIEERMNK